MTQTRFQKVVYDILSELEFPVYQDRPEVLVDMPVITFTVEEYPDWTFSDDIGAENAIVIVDIFGLDSETTTEIKESVVSKMIEYGYRATGVRTVPDPDGYSHLNLQFSF